MRRATLALALATALACARPPAQGRPRPGAPLVELALPGDALRGSSGLALAPDGTLWAAPERTRTLVPLTADAGGFRVGAPLPIVGLPEGLDLESLAHVAPGVLAAGTESQARGRAGDAIVLLRVGAREARVEGPPLALAYAPFGLAAEPNRGVEGLCATGGALVAAGEVAGVHEGRRFAPVAVFGLESGALARWRLALTTDTGKVSALSCREVGGRLEVLAVERHPGVSRVLRFELPRDGGGWVVPELLVDLAAELDGPPPNVEGLERLPDGRLALLTDNDHGGVQGPTRLFLRDPAPR